MADWLKIKSEYISTSISTRKLAEKHGVSYSTLRKRAEKEGWTDAKVAQGRRLDAKVAQKVAERTSDREADRIVRLLRTGDALAERLELAVAELDRQTAKQTVKTKTVEYGDPDAYGKPTREVIEEKTDIVTIENAPIDRMGVRLLASALRDLLEVAKAAREEKADNMPRIIDNIPGVQAAPHEKEEADHG